MPMENVYVKEEVYTKLMSAKKEGQSVAKFIGELLQKWESGELQTP